jgi:oligopeptide/dipeptide ABC transporter, ATP-binding protein, C-terminal domain
MELLEIKNMTVTYATGDRPVLALDDVSIHVSRGQSLGIVGESGSGKSTLALAVLRLLPPRVAAVSGSVKLLGEDLLAASEARLRQIRWKQLSVVFQKSMNGLSPVHRIGSQVEDIYRIHEPGASRAQIRAKVESLFSLVSLPARVYRMYPHELSGGMLQRVSIALSLLHEPPLLILDESTTALDVVTQTQILSEIIRMEETMDVTRLMITHDISVVATTCRRVAVLYAGRLMEEGDVAAVLHEPAHPYTQGLVRSFPALTGERQALSGIPGALPDLKLRCGGCIFAARCDKASGRCRTERPALRQLPDGRKVSCHLYGGEGI